MNPLFFSMLAGHLVADFWLQPSNWIDSKRQNGWRSGRLIIHAFLAAIIPVLCTLQPSLWWFFPPIFIAHYLIDLLKSKLKDTLPAFLADQVVHVGLLWVLANFGSQPDAVAHLQKFWIYVTGFVLITTPSGIMIVKFLQPITRTANRSINGDSSAWIGIIERMLILIFILVNQFQAIGFLVAAKSVFRFGEIQKEGNLKAEYFLLGTLVSFLIAVVVGIGMTYLVRN